MADLNSFLNPLKLLPVENNNIYNNIIYNIYYENVCCLYSLELPHQCDSIEYTHYTMIL